MEQPVCNVIKATTLICLLNNVWLATSNVWLLYLIHPMIVLPAILVIDLQKEIVLSSRLLPLLPMVILYLFSQWLYQFNIFRSP
jgi:hypothetical protein